jgi:heptosyltransferase-2
MKMGSTGSYTNFRWKNDRILVIAPNWLGDAVMATPSFKLIKQFGPHVEIDLLCREYVSEVFNRNPNLDRVIDYRKDKGYFSLFSILRKMRPPQGWQACIVMPRSFSSGLAAWVSGAVVRIGYSGEFRGMFLTDSIPAKYYKRQHLSRSYGKLVEVYTKNGTDKMGDALVVPPPEWENIVEKKVGDSRYFVLATGASYGSAKIWPYQRYAQLSRKLTDHTSMKAVAIGKDEDRGTANSIIGSSNADGLNLTGKCNLRELVAVLKGAELVIGNDSGPVHISAAMGTRTVTVFGSTNPEWTAPLGKYTTVVRNKVDCSPCFERECPNGSLRCLLGVEVSDVFEAAIRLLEEQ